MNPGMNKIKIGNYNVPVYIPENCNEETRIVVYYNGSGGPYPDRTPLETELKENGSDAIVVFASNGNYDQVNGAINQVVEQYNIKELNVTPIGFSMGSYFSTKETLKVINNNPDASPQVLVHLDGFNTALPSMFKKNAQTLVDNNSVVISVYGNKKGYKHLKDYKALAEAGVNVLFVNYKNMNARDHILVNRDFFSNGNLNFLAGTGELNDMYSISVYDKETGGLKEINFNDANSLEKIYDYFGIKTSIEFKLEKLLSLNNFSLENLSISTDTGILSQPLNNIIGKIKNTSCLQSSSQTLNSFASTTKFPSQIPAISTLHFETSVDLLYKLANDMKEFSKIGPLIDKIDRNLVNEAIQLNEQQNAAVAVQPTTLSTTQNSNIGTVAAASVTSGLVSSNLLKDTNSVNTEITSTGSMIAKQVENVPLSNISSGNKVNGTSNYSSSNYSNNYVSSPKKNVSVYDQVQSNEEFPKYENMYSDDSRIVYNYNDEYKIIIHKDGDKITGIEHYYDFGTENNANIALKTLKTEYANIENMDKIMQQGRYVKIVFNEDMYNNLTVDEIRNKYSGLSEIVRI